MHGTGYGEHHDYSQTQRELCVLSRPTPISRTPTNWTGLKEHAINQATLNVFSCQRRSAISWKVTSSIPDDILAFCFWLAWSFQLHCVPECDSASNRNEQQDSSWGEKRGRRVRQTTSPPFVSRLSRQCGILNFSQPYRTARPVMRIFFFSMQFKFVPHRKHIYEPPRSVTGIALLLYMYMTFVPHRKHIYESPRPVTGIALILYMYMAFVSHREHSYEPP
jgi:hypothetical protein